jgi:transcriptional regulator with GAF, ATPase, and Fis domain
MMEALPVQEDAVSQSDPPMPDLQYAADVLAESTPGPVTLPADDVAALLARLSTVLVQDEDVDAALRRIVVLAGDAIDGCTAAGITLVDHRGRPSTAASTHEKTLAVDQAQYVVGSGPCLDALVQRRVNRVDVDEAEARWPRFTAAAREAGIRSFLAAPLMVGERAVGALNLYGAAPAAFDRLDEAYLALFSAQASAVISAVRRYADASALAEQMRTALGSRGVIEQAKGVLVGALSCDADMAFEVLSRWSQAANVKLRELAATVVQRAVDGDVQALLREAGIGR